MQSFLLLYSMWANYILYKSLVYRVTPRVRYLSLSWDFRKVSRETLLMYTICLGIGNTTQVAWGDNRTCNRLMRWDPLTNSCYIPCEDWDWRTESEKQFRLFATHTTSITSIVCLIVMIITWIKLKSL